MSSTDLPPVPPAGDALPRVAPVHADGERIRSVALRGVTLSVRSRGGAREDAEPALFVHGLGGSSQNWSALMPLLDDLLDCEAVDLPGFGDSPPPDDGDYSLNGHTRAVVRYLEASGRGPVHLFGNSMGGAVATKVAALRPDLVRTLTLVSPALPELRVQRSAVPTGLLAVPGVAALFTRLTREWTAEQRVRGVLALTYGDPGKVTDEGVSAAVAEMERRQRLPYFWDAMARSARGIVDAYTLAGRHRLWRHAERVTAPTLLVYGGRDRLVSFRMARRAARAFAGSRLLALPEAGHVAMMECPDTVARAFREFLQDTAFAGTAHAGTAGPAGGDARESRPGGPDDVLAATETES
jgi:pimeloyl-ACP methyl ester carboxylesterase